jgi:lauroyl/myristoyl acyltransferase
LRVVGRGGEIVPAVGGTEQLAALLRPGSALALAPDFPGRTPVTFLGRKVLGSFGTARIAMLADSPVVLITQHRDRSGGSYIQVHPPLEPRDYSEPRELLDEVLAGHGEAILAWPEALESPTARFGRIDE